MEKNMTEQEYKTGNRIAVTYFLQFFCAVLAVSAAYFAFMALRHHHYGSLRLQAMLCAVNVGLFLFEANIRKNLQCRL